jgi:hypothetical protein
MNVRVTFLESTALGMVMEQVRKYMHSATILAHSPGFDFCQIKYWRNTVHSLVTTEKENNTNTKLLVFIS